MLEKQIIKLLLNKEFYTKHKSKINKGILVNGVGNIYETIVKAHKKYDKNLSS